MTGGKGLSTENKTCPSNKRRSLIISLSVFVPREQDMWQLAEDGQHHCYSRYRHSHKGRNNNNNNSQDVVLSARDSRSHAVCDSVHACGCVLLLTRSEMQIKSSEVLLIIVEIFNEIVFSVTDATSSRPTVLPALMATLIHSLLSRATTIPGHSYTTTQDLQTSLAHHIFTSDPAQAWNTTQLQVLGRRGSMEHRTEL